jgi:LPXTG-motif cell wall-anchored protein
MTIMSLRPHPAAPAVHEHDLGESHMNRRIGATAAAVAALVLAPAAAASAYEASDFDSTVTATSVTAGQAINYAIDGPEVNDEITVTVTSSPASIPDSAIAIAGTASLTKATDANGDAAFAITLSAAGTYTFTAVDAEGDVINTQAVAVAAAGAPSATLPVTGSSATPLALGGGALALAGIGTVLFAKRRNQARI